MLYWITPILYRLVSTPITGTIFIPILSILLIPYMVSELDLRQSPKSLIEALSSSHHLHSGWRFCSINYGFSAQVKKVIWFYGSVIHSWPNSTSEATGLIFKKHEHHPGICWFDWSILQSTKFLMVDFHFLGYSNQFKWSHALLIAIGLRVLIDSTVGPTNFDHISESSFLLGHLIFLEVNIIFL